MCVYSIVPENFLENPSLLLVSNASVINNVSILCVSQFLAFYLASLCIIICHYLTNYIKI